MKFQDLNEKLKTIPVDGILNLIPDTFNDGNILDFFRSIIISNEFIINVDNSKLILDKDKIFICGTTLSLDLLANVELTFEEENNNLSCSAHFLFNKSLRIANLPWFEFEKPELNFVIYDGQYPVNGTSGGIIDLGVKLQLYMRFPNRGDRWLWRGIFDKPYPSIFTLSHLIDGVNLIDIAPEPISKFTNLGISEIEIEYDIKDNILSSISFIITTNESWLIISELNLLVTSIKINCKASKSEGISIENKFSFDIIGGLSIGSNQTSLIIFAKQFQDNWMIAAYIPTGETVSFSDIASLFFCDYICIPSELKVINFSSLILSIIPQSGVICFSAKSLNSWRITDSFYAEGFKLKFQRDPANINSITGSISCSIFIVNVDIQVFTELTKFSDRGWDFSGSTGQGQEIQIGILIEDLTTKFGVITLPSAIADLIIENLSISFNTQTKDFTFTCEGKFSIDNQEVDIIVSIDLNHNGTDYTKTFSGHITIGLLIFDINFIQNTISNLLVGTYSHTGASQKLKIQALIAAVSAATAADIPESLEIDLKDAVFVFSKDSTGSKFLFGLDIGTDINLSNLPLIGREFPPEQTVGVDDLQLLVATKDLTIEEVTAINSLLPPGVTQLPLAASAPPAGNNTPTVAIAKGLNVAATLKFGASPPQFLTLPAGETPQPLPNPDPSLTPTPPPPPALASTPPIDDAKWFTIQKSFGPVNFQRVGVRYQDATVWFLLDAALSLAGLTLSLDGLAVGSPLAKFSPEFDLRGLGIAYESDPIEIGAAFLRVRVTATDGTTYDEYDGAAIIKTAELTLSAIGSYAYLNGHPSLFIYAVLDYPLGGPSFFFVTGLAAGFGYNRALLVPPIDRIAQFPLVAAAINPQPSTGANDAQKLTEELTKIRQYIPPSTGEMFLAVGVKFTSFKLIDAFVLVTVAFGNRFELNVLGLATAIIPTPVAASVVTPLAEIQMAIKASFIPDEGFLGVIAQLTTASYVLSKDCHLTGGFAFYTWFSGQYAGDFVITLGGYHPRFKVPAHYPQVPRLGLSWQVNSELSIKGGLYFALTAPVLMAGGYLQANWNSGNLTAYFNAGADFTIAWQPYHYDAHVYANMAVSYTFDFFGTHTINVDVGADLHIWGPEFSGLAHIHLSIISFDLGFGDRSNQSPQPIDWTTFKTSFLPADANICSVAVKDGLLKKVSSAATDLGVINPKYLSLVTNSAIPCKQAYLKNTVGGRKLDVEAANQNFGIGSMAIVADSLSSTQMIQIVREDGTHVEDEFDYLPIFKNVPIGLWGQSLTADLNGDKFVNNALSGFEIKPKNRVAAGETALISRSQLQFNTETLDNAYQWEILDTFAPAPLEDAVRKNIIETTIDNPTRNQLLRSLGLSDVEIQGITLSASVADDFSIAPQIELQLIS
jgi:hypothetical protein